MSGRVPGDMWRVQMMAQGVRLVLPGRRVRRQRAVGLGIVAVSLGAVALAALLSRGFWWPGVVALARGGGSGVFGLVGLVFPLAAAWVFLHGVRFGLLVAFGHTEVAVGGGELVSDERWGPVRRRTRIPADAVRSLSVTGKRLGKARAASAGKGERGSDDPWALDNLAALNVKIEHKDPKRREASIVMAYPQTVVAALGDEIGERLGVAVGRKAWSLWSGEDKRGRGATYTYNPTVVMTRPAKSTAVLTRTGEGVTIELPARGFFRGSRGLGSFVVLWTLFTGGFTAAFVAKGVQGGVKGLDLVPIAMCGVFTLVGAAMFCGALRSGRRRGLIDVVPDGLVVTRRSVGRPRSDAWSPAELDRVVVAPSGVEINDRPVLELQVWDKRGKKTGLFPERDDDELRWIAWEINTALERDRSGSAAAHRVVGSLLAAVFDRAE